MEPGIPGPAGQLLARLPDRHQRRHPAGDRTRQRFDLDPLVPAAGDQDDRLVEGGQGFIGRIGVGCLRVVVPTDPLEGPDRFEPVLDGFELPDGVGHPFDGNARRVAGAQRGHHIAQIVLTGQRYVCGRQHPIPISGLTRNRT